VLLSDSVGDAHKISTRKFIVVNMDVHAVRTLTRKQIGKHRSQAQWARSIGATPQEVSQMLRSRDPGGKVLEELGLEKAPASYRKKALDHRGTA
jgi:hypothetical protein